MTTEQIVIGVDIGSSSLKAVLLERRAETFVCLGLHVVRYPDGEPVTSETVDRALKEVADLFGGRTRRAALVTSDREIQVKFVEKPVMTRENLELVMQNEFKASLSSPADLETTGFVYTVAGEIRTDAGTTIQVLTATFPLAHLRQKVAQFTAAGLQLVGIFPFATAARECLVANHLDEIREEESPFLVALINFGATHNQVSVCDKQVLRLSRTFPFAGEELSQTLVKPYTVDGQEVALDRNMAEAYKATVGILSPEEVAGYGPQALEVQVSDLIRRGLDRMTQKLRLSLDYFKGQMKAQVARAYIFGGGANLRGLLDNLGNLLVVNEIKELSAFDKIPYTPEGPMAYDPPAEFRSLVALAMGAALCSFQRETDALDLLVPLHGEQAKRMRVLVEKVVAPACLAIAALLVPLFYWWLVYQPTIDQIAALTADHASMAKEYAEVSVYKAEYDKLVKQQQDLKIRSIFIQNITRRKLFWSQILFDLHTLVPEDVWLTELTSSAFAGDDAEAPPRGGDTLLLKGSSRTYASLSAFLKNLEGSPLVSGMSWRESKREDSGEILFTVTCSLVPGGKKP